MSSPRSECSQKWGHHTRNVAVSTCNLLGEPSGRAARAAQTGQLIRQLQPDVVCFQELVSRSQAAALATGLGAGYELLLAPRTSCWRVPPYPCWCFAPAASLMALYFAAGTGLVVLPKPALAAAVSLAVLLTPLVFRPVAHFLAGIHNPSGLGFAVRTSGGHVRNPRTASFSRFQPKSYQVCSAARGRCWVARWAVSFFSEVCFDPACLSLTVSVGGGDTLRVCNVHMVTGLENDQAHLNQALTVVRQAAHVVAGDFNCRASGPAAARMVRFRYVLATSGLAPSWDPSTNRLARAQGGRAAADIDQIWGLRGFKIGGAERTENEFSDHHLMTVQFQF